MSMFEIRAAWPQQTPPPDVADAVEDRLTLSEVAISVGRSDLAGLIADDGYRAGPRVSAYRLAEWLVWNWWRLRWEAGPAFSSRALPMDWVRAHETTGIGGPWLWPRMTITGDGLRVALRVAPTTATETEPLAYVGRVGIVAASSFEEGVDAFVTRVLRRLDDHSLRETGLHTAYSELKSERADESASQYRKVEALCGRDVDCAPPNFVAQAIADSLAVGRNAVEELVADQSLTERPSATRLRGIAHKSGHDVRSGDGIKVSFTPREQSGSVAPWIVGVDAARAVRTEGGLGGGPVKDDRLAEMYGVSSNCLRYRRQAPMSFSYDDGRRELAVVRSGVRTGRRFELARLLADRLLVEDDEALRPATHGATFRQKVQRAFAAELLCPFNDLCDVLSGDYSPEAMERAARQYGVSPLLVRSHLASHGLVEMHEQDEIDTPSMHDALGVGFAA